MLVTQDAAASPVAPDRAANTAKPTIGFYDWDVERRMALDWGRMV